MLGSADIFFVDTTPFVQKYFDNPKKQVFDWRNVLPRDRYMSSTLKVSIPVLVVFFLECNKLIYLVYVNLESECVTGEFQGTLENCGWTPHNKKHWISW